MWRLKVPRSRSANSAVLNNREFIIQSSSDADRCSDEQRLFSLKTSPHCSNMSPSCDRDLFKPFTGQSFKYLKQASNFISSLLPPLPTPLPSSLLLTRVNSSGFFNRSSHMIFNTSYHPRLVICIFLKYYTQKWPYSPSVLYFLRYIYF